MRRAIWIVLAAVVAVAVAWFLAGLPGTVSVSIGTTTVETATSLAIVGVVVIVVVLVVALRLLGWVFGVPMRIGHWRGRRRRVDGDEAVTRTLVALAAGEPGAARRESARARKMLGDTPQTLLLAAEAGRLAEREDEAAALYRQLAARNDAALLGLRGLFRQAMNREAWAEAAQIAKRAEEVHPAGAWLHDERAQLAVRTGNWAEALRLTGPGGARAALATAAADAEPNADAALRLAKQAWKQSPGFAPAALTYAKRLRAAGRDVKAFNVIREAWRARPQPDLSDFWLNGIVEPLTRVREAERLAATNPDHPETHLMLARASLQAEMVGEARAHLEKARAGGMNQRRLWVLLADLEAAERGETEAGRLAQRDALRRAASAEPDPDWHCEVCGSEYTAWQPACPTCHTAGRISWGAKRLALTAG
jgi:HemY protein